ncbi:hypothetical protein VE25_19945 [Devosia geojensis]|uniref:Uncharacterized protein n=1 Tax=Devosia geojensis TaxID=443610 RepID=A0A0F5FDD3_9HYPH|nr:hypothetical protein [Devosia geojensis]KKB06934.1 hypothetical protein VE25_19945 [Devosia geojensis]
MKAFFALVHRELLEHRGAFLIAPLALIGILFSMLVLAYVTGRLNFELAGMARPLPIRVFEIGFLGFAVAWWLYLLGVLFFYCADGFAADKRNNSMLFWKSMPQSDLKILLAKFGAATTLFPGLVYAAALACGVLAYILTLIMVSATGGNLGVFMSGAFMSYLSIAGGILVALAASILWFAPFLAWVGALSTAVGRWSVPLAVLVPALAVAIENMYVRGPSPEGGWIWSYLTYRLDFPVDREGYLQAWFLSGARFDAYRFSLDLIDRMDWVQVLIGLAFAFAAIFVASEYRRRTIDN